MSNLPYAEDVNYWKTSSGSPDSWLDKTVKLIEGFGGQVLEEYAGTDRTTGKAAYKLVFRYSDDLFDIIWPVLPTRSGKDLEAAKRQAVTTLYHRVKANLIHARIFGMRRAFFEFWQLPDGRTAGQVSGQEFLDNTPKLLQSPSLPILEAEVME